MSDQTAHPPFNATRQCCWCGSDNTSGTVGYAGERDCPRCGWGGDGEPDVPCMFYKLVRPESPTGPYSGRSM